LPSITATQLLVVPKSIPMIFPISVIVNFSMLYALKVNDYATGHLLPKGDRVA
jgi:hypothetical protein